MQNYFAWEANFNLMVREASGIGASYHASGIYGSAIDENYLGSCVHDFAEHLDLPKVWLASRQRRGRSL